METNVSTNNKRATSYHQKLRVARSSHSTKQSNIIRPIHCFQNTQAHDKSSVTEGRHQEYRKFKGKNLLKSLGANYFILFYFSLFTLQTNVGLFQKHTHLLQYLRMFTKIYLL
jgi:hypothetical protein